MNKNFDILFRNFDVFQNSKEEAKSLKSFVFHLAISGRLDFQKLSEGRIKQPLKALVREQTAYLQKEGIAFEEQPDSVWPMVELGTVCEFNPKKSKVKNLPKNQLVSFVPMAELMTHNPNFRIKNERKLKDVYSGYTYFAEEDVLLARVTPCFENGKSGIARNLKNGVGFGSSEFFVYRSNKKIILSEIIYYFISGNTFIDSGKKNMSGTGGLQRLTKNYAIKYKIPLSPLKIQKEIVALMEKCVLLETQTKEKSQKQEEFSKSSIYSVTQSKNKAELIHNWKNLKDNFKDILYSENGAKNFKNMIFQFCLSGRLDFQKLSNGRIKKPLQNLIREQKQHLKTEGIAFEEQPDNVWPMVKLGDICKLYQPKTISKKEMIKTGKYLVFGANGVIGRYNKYNHEDSEILIGCRGTCGIINLSEPKSWITGNAMVVKILSFKVNKKFFFHLLQNSDFESVITGAAQPQITRQKLAPFPIPLPHIKIQREIVALMESAENMRKQIQEEKSLSVQLSQSLSHLKSHKNHKNQFN